jgi:ETFB lysine methyltransferase
VTDPITALSALEGELHRRFRTRETIVDAPGGPLHILHPANADDLITEADYVRDERLPYWADLWPSSIALARVLHKLLPRRGTLLELGCGAGLIATTAARIGQAVLATDYYEDALCFARVNALRNGGNDIAVRHVDWRHFPGDLGRFDTVIACDVLYERPYAALVAEAIARSLAPDGVALVADPGRVAADAFLEAAGLRGLGVRALTALPYQEGNVQQSIRLYQLRAARSDAASPAD